MIESQTIVGQKIEAQGLLPLFYQEDASVCLAIAHALYAAGVRCLEFTNRGAHAAQNFAALVAERNSSMQDLLLGIGTIKTGEEATRFIDLGADFLVSPLFDASVYDIAYMNKVLWIPGCMTPTEINQAQQSGCSLVKLFPGNVLGPGFVQAILPLFNGIRFLVTGGVEPTKEGIGAWLKAGVCAVGMGSQLITHALVQDNAYGELTANTKAVLEWIDDFKK
jgi:2-dehydro-3-deoxyphosphogluconate aldolase / (4S)-4-hydroxy-2-oxoglutarate aldolase